MWMMLPSCSASRPVPPPSPPTSPLTSTKPPAPLPGQDEFYASSKEALNTPSPGLATELQANDADDIEYETVVKTVSKGTAA